MYKNKDEEMVLCPYNRSHVVSKLRIQKHIIKCQKNNPNVKLATCFYNFTHRLKPEDMLKHYEVCAHRTRVEGARYYEPGSYQPLDFSLKSHNNSFHFPTGRVKKDNHFYNPCPVELDSSQREKYVAALTTSESDSESLPKTVLHKNVDIDGDKPLPLPKTVSKAFTSIKQPKESSVSTFGASQERGFGRAKNFLMHSSPSKPRSTDHLLPDVSEINVGLRGKTAVSKRSSTRKTSCSASIASSILDDSTTLKSQTIIFDDDDDDDDDEDQKDIDFNFDIDKYVKI